MSKCEILFTVRSALFDRPLILNSNLIPSYLPLKLWCHIRSKELSDHFEEKLRRAHQANGLCTDSWTLPILSRAIRESVIPPSSDILLTSPLQDHSAIGDAIGEDGSRFLAIHEVEMFARRRPAGITLPEWLV